MTMSSPSRNNRPTHPRRRRSRVKPRERRYVVSDTPVRKGIVGEPWQRPDGKWVSRLKRAPRRHKAGELRHSLVNHETAPDWSAGDIRGPAPKTGPGSADG